ncbi:LysR substrate-binding domain-containing protein [Curtobacterium sp. MCBD17_040]|uniref:LysR family transcriptional regulator n=1 Tax=Curtobacterium sp. MCBD17_040 TaxID=2175674 RepID=UPI000DA75AF5|nr:LysR substrate-binding domain-containing protein [Curtobacterium sp. MCBD17_040]WIB62980.1 LysR substrate-binding domain-containing protein [Curtobacterium sp. MCBD17_040]
MNADLDLRKLRYFVAVADTLSFGRAAEQLRIAQPVLSRQIRALEQELGTQLFVRDTRGTELTDNGRLLRAEVQPLLASAAAVRRRVAIAARGEDVFTVGFMPGLTVTGAVRTFRRGAPEVDVRVMRTGWEDQVAVLHDGRADVSYLREPFDGAEVRTVFLHDEPRVVMLPSDHPLAGTDQVTMGDLGSEELLQDPAAVPEWSGSAPSRRAGDGSAKRRSRTVEEKLELVAGGAGVAILPLSTARFYRRLDVRFVAVTDLAPTAVHIAWEASRASARIAAFVDAARADVAPL